MNFTYPAHLYSLSCISQCFSITLISYCLHALSSFRATPQGHMQTYCPLCLLHRELHMLPTPHTSITTTITIIAAIYLFVCYRQLWYSPLCCSVFMASSVVQLYNCQWCCGVFICVMSPKEFVFMLFTVV